MSDAGLSLPDLAGSERSELEALIERIVERTLSQIGHLEKTPFVNSTACSELLGVTPEHLCAMRARGEGPPWSGAGKWIRYRRSDVLTWLASLPR
ncbi:hypothetical protein ABIB68_002163 [Bradyrhizobium sp. F1.2.2]